MTCAGPSVVHGVDVSTYQGTIMWSQVKAAGIDFAFARISDGTTHPDAQFASNWMGMRGAGVTRGSYQYFRAGADPAAQANLVVSSLNAAGGLQPRDLPVVMDLETTDGQPASTIEANMRTWLAIVQAQTGRSPIIYTSSGLYPVMTAAFASYPLWVANWTTGCPTMPIGWSTWKFWQYSDMGAVSGIAVPVDLDEFDGTLAALTSFAGTLAYGGSVDAASNEGGSRIDVADAGGRLRAADATSEAPGTSPADAGSSWLPDTGASAISDAGATMGGGRVDGSPATQACPP